MAGKTHIRAAMVVVAFSLGCSAFASAALGESFDKPVRETTVDLGPSPSQDPRGRFRVTLSCFYYSAFVVKELDDDGLKGTRWVTIVPVSDGHITACKRSHGSTERFIAKEWWSFFGVKDSFLFLEAADGENGGMAFRVLDLKTGKKIFEDTALFWDSGRRIPLLEIAGISEGRLLIRYRRVVEAGCSIPKDGASCWNEIRKRYGFQPGPMPKCAGYVEPGKKKWAIGDEGVPPDEIDSLSVIAYPVEVELLPRPAIGVAPGSVTCSAPD